MRKMETKELVFMAFYACLALVLEYVNQFIPFLQMPQGGSINVAIIPIFIASYQLGVKKGIITALLCWGLGFLMGFNAWFLNVPQYLLDYIIPVVVVGAAAVLPKLGKISNVYVGVVVAGIIRFASTVLSGVYYWFPEGEPAGSAYAWTYSLGYNFYYNFATLIVAIILVPILINRLKATHVPFVGIKE